MAGWRPYMLLLFLGWMVQGSARAATVEAREHWAFTPLKKPSVPAVFGAHRHHVINPIDAFILARLEREGLVPAPEADRRTLLRRLSYDLTGLPPTPEEVAAFECSADPGDYERAVLRLLNSPQYGEHWARHWLDVVHYADTHGNDHDFARFNAWPYRDYVIAAFNSDKPYGRFIQEQVAGDVLFPNEPEATVALGFLAAGPWDDTLMVTVREDTVDHQISKVLDRDNMVTTVMSTFQSLTVHCARCHDHKFDPVSQREYYSLQAVFAGVDRADRPFDSDPRLHAQRQQLLNRKHNIAARAPSIMASLGSIETEIEALSSQVRHWNDAWKPLDAVGVASAHGTAGTTFARLEDQSWLVRGTRPDRDTFIVTAQTTLENVRALRLEVLPHDELPQKGPGRYDNGNFHLSEIRASIQPSSGPTPGADPVQFVRATVDHSGDGQGGPGLIDGKSETYWSVHPRYGEPHDAILELKNPAGFPGGSTFVIRLEHEEMKGHQIGRFRFWVTAEPPDRLQRPTLPSNIVALLQLARAERSPAQQEELALYALNAAADRELALLPPPRMVYAATRDFVPSGSFKPSLLPRPIHLLKRGDINRPADLAAPGTLSCLPGLPPEFALADENDEAARRAALARWLSDDGNPLTWRSIVNRVWQYHFGRGLVETPNDFGHMGAAPSHPGLLDWLAVWFRDEAHGSLKSLHYLILTSATWRQSSLASQGADVDQDNRLLWRQNRQRLTAEEVRDTMLQLSGRLNPTMGGPAAIQFVHHDNATFNTGGAPPILEYDSFDPDSPAAQRRAVYRFLFRTVPDPLMDTLDCPDGSAIVPVRAVSTTALQALAMLNDHFLLRECRHLAARVARDSPGTELQVESLAQWMFQRHLTPDETQRLSQHVDRHGLANTAHLLMNSNEFMFLD